MKFLYIAGCQRSGTTLLRLILECHSAIVCLDEDRSYATVPRLRESAGRDALRTLQRPWIGFKIPRFSEQLIERSISDPDYGSFPNFYDAEPVLFMIRDVRDVVVSMMRLTFDDGQSWLDRFGRSILAFKRRDPGFARRYRRELALLDDWGQSPEGVGALYWKFKSTAYLDYLAAGLPVYGIVYERLVSEPRKVLSGAMAFLELPWEEALMDHPNHEHGEVDASGHAIGNTDVRRPIHSLSVGVHRDGLGADALARIDAIVETLPERLLQAAPR